MVLFLKNLAFTVLVPGTVAMIVPLFLIPHGPAGTAWQSWAGWPLLVIGTAIYVWCVWDFGVHGRGTPAPIDPPTRLVVRGLYRLTRNPMYVGVLSVIAGWALLFGSLNIVVYGLVVGLCFHVFVIVYEEPHLRKVFGPGYEEYCRTVGRWVW